MSQSKGLMLSVFGAAVFLVSLAGLAVLPTNIPVIVGILAGGLIVWSGLIWTLSTYYSGELPGRPRA